MLQGLQCLTGKPSAVCTPVLYAAPWALPVACSPALPTLPAPLRPLAAAAAALLYWRQLASFLMAAELLLYLAGAVAFLRNGGHDRWAVLRPAGRGPLGGSKQGRAAFWAAAALHPTSCAGQPHRGPTPCLRNTNWTKGNPKVCPKFAKIAQVDRPVGPPLPPLLRDPRHHPARLAAAVQRGGGGRGGCGGGRGRGGVPERMRASPFCRQLQLHE